MSERTDTDRAEMRSRVLEPRSNFENQTITAAMRGIMHGGTSLVVSKGDGEESEQIMLKS